jgi:hypothetical protein
MREGGGGVGGGRQSTIQNNNKCYVLSNNLYGPNKILPVREKFSRSADFCSACMLNMFK